MIESAPNLNYVWAGALAEELARLGVDEAAIAPGSRSSPLALSLGTHARIRSIVHWDERGLAFHALGVGRATRRPCVVVTTSGTAVANLLPAVAEAYQDRVPLLVITADRPPELRDTGANQTMDQVKLFGSFARWQADVPCPGEEMPLRAWLTTIDQAVFRTQHPVPGPVHLNVMLREPLAPTRRPFSRRRVFAELRGWLTGSAPFTRYGSTRGVADDAWVSAAAERLGGARRGIVLAGELCPRDRAAAARLADDWGWPLLPDVRSGLRFGAEGRTVAGLADLALSAPDWAAAHGPDVVLHLGGRVTSKRLAEFAGRCTGAYIHAAPYPDRQDPGHRVSLRGTGDLAELCSRLQRAVAPREDGAWLSAWLRAEARAEEALAAAMAREGNVSEPRVAYDLARLLPEGHGLFAGNSLPIRLLEAFGDPRVRALDLAANRGVSGIDGVLASAVGWAAGRGRPVSLLIGDLSLLHDLNSLALLAACPVPVTVVVLNNDGGGIFSFLPVASRERAFERLFATPHGRSFADAARMFGLPHATVTSAAGFARAVRAAQRSGRSSLVEVRTRRADTVRAYRRVQAAVARALG